MAASMKEPMHLAKKKKSLKISSKVIEDIKSRADAISENAENSNDLIWLIEQTHHEEENVILAAIKSLHKVFSRFLRENAMATSEANHAGAESSEKKYKVWLQSRYRDCVKSLTHLISDKPRSSIIQELAVCTLMKFLEAECHYPVNTQDKYHFETSILTGLMPHLLSKKHDKKELLGRFQEYLEYDDVRFYLLYQVGNYLAQQAASAPSKEEVEILCSNSLFLLEMFSMPTEDESIEKFLGQTPDEDEDVRVVSLKEHRKAFSSAWLAFLRLKLPSHIYKHVLVILHDDVMPHMHSPVLLTDFLTASYNIGGVISLLALNGLFVLINQYNLEYPQFYKKLYGLFDSSVFHVKYKSRFFRLADLFLSSTHLPAYLVAAFAKRLSRLSLTAPPHSLQLVIPFIINLIVRHPSCEILLHRTDGPTDFASDPYLFDESDPAKSKALESCLWELDALRSHYHPGVSSSAKKLQLPLPKMEEDLSEHLEMEISDLMDSETQRKIRTVPLEFNPAKGLFGGKDDKFSSDFWMLK